MQASRTWHLDWLFFMLVAVCASDITSFTDAKCTRSWRSVDTVNGYPDGLCKPLNVTAGQSFQVQQLDPGCAVTLYGENAGPLSCSSPIKTVGHLAMCYDASWIYYSIDGCLPPAPSSSKPIAVVPTATGPSATTAASAAAEPKVHISVIIGSTVAGVSCVVLGLAATLLILRKRRKSNTPIPTHELPEERALAESDATAEKKHPKELWGDHAAVEIGRNSRFEGMMRAPQPLRAVNPAIRICLVP